MKKFTLFMLSLLVALCAFASPADKSAYAHKQSDGTTLILTLKGDEFFHYYSTLDGVPVKKNAQGDYCYAVLDENNIFVSTDIIAHNKELRNFEEKNLVDANVFSGMAKEMKKIARARAMEYAPKKVASVSPVGKVNVPVLLVEYSDVKFTFDKELVSDILNKKGYEGYQASGIKSLGSAKDYFLEQSGGKFEPNFIVTDIVTLPNKMAYYGANDSKGNDVRVGRMIADGLSAADANFDFSIFDNDGDGSAEFLYCVYAGFGESYSGNDENTVWPCSSELRSDVGRKTHDGVSFNLYACSSEIALTEEDAKYHGKFLNGIGLVCHEFSHCLGLPDTYDVDYNGGSTMQYWDLMDCGNYAADGYVPVGYNAYQRDFMGWKNLEELTEKGDYSMLPLTSGGSGYKIVNEANRNEFYVLENRKQEAWDTYLFANGMLITYVDYNKSVWDKNELNTDTSHLRYKLIPADNEIIAFDGGNGAAAAASFRGDVWPGTSGNTSFTDTSLPAAKWHSGKAVGKPVTNIKLTDDILSFSFMRGIVGVPSVLSATDITDSGFTANWALVDDATEYTVELEKVTNAVSGEGDPVLMLQENFAKCVNSNETINDIDDYTTIPGWTGSKLYGESGVMRVGASSSAGLLRTPKLNHDGKVTVSLSLVNYSSNDTGSVLTVSLIADNGLVLSTESVTATSAWAEKEFAFDASGDFYIEFSTINSTGKKRVNIDNVVVEYKSSVASELVDRVTVEGSSYVFTNLEGSGTYRYRVSASDGYGSSAFSAYENVTILPTSIEGVTADKNSACAIYTIGGILLYEGGFDSVPELPAGIYIIKTVSATKKLVVE